MTFNVPDLVSIGDEVGVQTRLLEHSYSNQVYSVELEVSQS